MKKLILPLLAALLMPPAFARDFEYTYEGQTLSYTVLDEEAKTCKTGTNKKVDGVLVIPSEASDGDEFYTVTEIGTGSFRDNYSIGKDREGLISVTIPNSVTSIGFAAFYQCTNMTEVIMGNSVTTMDADVFAWCTSLKSITLSSSLTSIPYRTFYHCESLTDIEIPNSVTEILGRSFICCYSLDSIRIPDSVSKLEDHIFYECTGLKEIVFPKNLTYLTPVCEKCDAIEKVVYRGSEPVEAPSGTFESTVYENATLFVPKGKANLFRKVEPWSLFKNIEEDEDSGVEEIVVDFAADCNVYDLNGVKVGNTVDELGSGIYIVRQGNTVTKVVK